MLKTLTQKQKSDVILALTIATIITLLFFVWPLIPAADRPEYFNFADKSDFFGISNAFDVLSNFGFLVTGALGLMWVSQNKSLPREYKVIARIFSISILLVAFGSGYFHLEPTKERLFWDRLPMAFGFGAIIALMIMDRISLKAGYKFALLFIPLSGCLVLGWHLDILTLRPYLVLQFGGIVLILLLTLIRKQSHISNLSVWAGIGLYALAKVVEHMDLKIYVLTGFLSGHTLKHIVATFAIVSLMSFLRKNYEGII